MIFDNEPDLKFDPEDDKNLNLNKDPKWITNNNSLKKIIGVIAMCIISLWGLFIYLV